MTPMTTSTRPANPPRLAPTALPIGLDDARFVSLVTFRRVGTPVSTPVLFVRDGGRLFVRTAHDAGKLKRIRHTPAVLVIPSDSRGRWLGDPVAGQARILADDAVVPTLRRLHAKHPVAARLFSAIRRLRGQRNVIVEILINESVA